jgi:4,5-dihydroxyphthalate decarboxylase
VVKDSLLKGDPSLAPRLFRAFQAAKAIYLAHLEAGENLSPADETAIAIKQVVGDPFPFGLSANRKAIETMVGFAVDQQIIPKKFSPEDLFASGTLDLT